MKRFFLAIFFTFALAVSSFATAITVGSYQVTNLWTYGGTSASIRIFARQTFTTNDSVTVLAGSLSSLYQSVPCTVTNLIVTCNSFTLNSTTNSSVPTAKYVAYLVDYKGIPRVLYLDNFSLGTSHGLNVTWPQIRADNLTVVGSLPNTYYTATQTDAAIAAAITGAGGFSSSWGSITGTLASQSDLQSALDTKQATLVSGTNIKTLNSQSLLGPGDIVIAGGSSATLANTYSNSLATAISTIGSTPTTLVVDTDTTVSTALTVPATLTLEIRNKAKITKSATGAINFQGTGLVNTNSQNAVFSGFAAGDITFTGAQVPSKLSASLWDDSDLSLKVKNADYAVKDNTAQATTIVVYPGTFATSDIIIHKGLSLHLTAGTYLNTIGTVASGHRALFIPQDNTKIYGDGRTRTFVYESSNNNPQIVCVSGFQLYPFDGANSNIEVRDFTIIGDTHTSIDSASSAINLGNTNQGVVTGMGFRSIHNFAVYVGGFSTAGNYAKGVWITHNFVDGSGTQIMGTVGGDDVHIEDNTFVNVQTPLFYVTDAVANGTATITSVTGGFTQALVNHKLTIKKFGQVDQSIYVLSVTDPNTLVLQSAVPWSATGVSVELMGASSSIIDVEPNSGTKGSDRLIIARNIMEGRSALTSWNGITVQKSYSDRVRFVDVSDNKIQGNSETVEYFTDSNISGDTITINNHGFQTGDAVQVSGGLVGVSPYLYCNVIRVDGDHIKLAYSYAYAMAGQNLTITLGTGAYDITQISTLANGIQMFGTEGSRVINNHIIGAQQNGLDIEGNYRAMIQGNTLDMANSVSIGNVASKFIGNISQETSLSHHPIGSQLIETDSAFTVNTTSGSSTVTVTGLGTAVPWYLTGESVIINGTTYTVFSKKDNDKYVLSANLPSTLTGQTMTIVSSNIYTGNFFKILTLSGTSGSQIKGALERVVSASSAQSVSGTNADWQPSVFANRYELTGTSTPVISGLKFSAAPLSYGLVDHEQHVFYNAGATAITITNEDAGSTAANRFHTSTSADISLAQYESAEIDYNSTLGRWIVTKKGGSAAASSSNIGSLFFDNTQLQHVNHGIFWRPNVQYGHFFWEATVKPEEGAGWSGYIVTDSQGGAHNLLWGMQPSATGFYGITGNVMMGSPPPVTITSVDTTFDTLTATAHGFWTGAMVTMASTGTLPGGLSPGTYYVIKIDANTIRLATTINNAEAATPVYVDLTSVGSGTITAAYPAPAGLISFGGGDEIPYDNWARLAVAWDGTSLLTWVNGVLSSITPFEGPYRLNPGGNNATLSIGGSDHSNYRGYIAEVRGYEGVDAAIPNSDYIPEMIMRPSQTFDNGVTVTEPQFFTNYTAESTIYPDLSGGFEGHFHHGIPEAVQSQSSQAGSIVGTSLSLPTFVRGAVTFGTYTPTPPSTPAGALIWDSFSRVNRDYLNPQDKTLGYYKLGNTEAGSLGIKTWTLPDGSADTSGHGIMNGAAFIQNQADNVCVDTGTQDVDVRVDRGITEWFGRTGLLVRYKDANDYYVIDAQDSAISVIKHEAGVVTGVTYVPTFGWKTLRVTAKGTAFNVYWGTATEGSFTLLGSFTGTNVTGATKECLYRPSAVKTVYRYDNFLVKAAP